MTENQLFAAIPLVAFLVLVLSGLMRRRLPTGRWLPLAAIWILIFVAAGVVATIGLRLH